MRVLVTSDFHGSQQAFQRVVAEANKLEIDLLVICGDITHFGSAKQAEELLLKIEKTNLKTIFVPGNCDLPSVLELNMENCLNLHGRSVEIGSYWFLGVGGAPLSPLQTPLEFPEEEIMKTLSKALSTLPNGEKRLVLVSHTPPFNTKVDLAFNGEHIGSKSIRNFVESYNPIIVFCGHIHEARGIGRIGNTFIVNPGPVRHGLYALAEINSEVKVKLARFG